MPITMQIAADSAADLRTQLADLLGGPLVTVGEPQPEVAAPKATRSRTKPPEAAAVPQPDPTPAASAETASDTTTAETPSESAPASASPTPEPKSTRTRKAPEAAAAPQPDPTPATTEAVATVREVSVPTAGDVSGPEANAAPTEPANDAAITYEDVRKGVLGLAAAKGRDAAEGVLKTLGVDHASKLTEEQWPAALEALTGALAA